MMTAKLVVKEARAKKDEAGAAAVMTCHTWKRNVPLVVVVVSNLIMERLS
jgi:hypothetical protein